MAGSGRGAASDSLGIDQEHRGKAHNTYVPPPVRGVRDSTFRARSPSIGDAGYPDTADAFSFGVRADLPRFDGANPRLWQNRCEDQFKLWNTPPHRWISLATSQFEGAVARWLESVQRKSPNISWSEFCCSLQSRFDRNQHQTLLRQLFRIAQTSTVADYVDRFADLYDQLSAYEEIPNTLHYTTRFLDGLKPGVRAAVVLQKPKDLDSAYDLALLHEELGEGVTHINSPAGVRSGPFPLPLPPKPRVCEDRRQSDTLKPTPADDKWSALRAYRKSKGICFICGEKWSRDHVCKSTVQLHFVQELIDHVQSMESTQTDSSESETASVHSMRLSAVAVGKDPNAPSLQLEIQLQGHTMVFLVDSGSTHSFIDSSFAPVLVDIQDTSAVSVTVAGGASLQCSQMLQQCKWSCCSAEFSSDFRLLQLSTYDGILGLDWLAQHSPMQVDWTQKWMSVQQSGRTVTLQGLLPADFALTVISLFLVQCSATSSVCPEMQAVLDKFPTVFQPPTGLPPRRMQDHHIPLISGARPVSVRPYRIAPQLKDELEKQIAELLSLGMIRPSKSPFSSPVLMVKKKEEGEWRLVFDFRHLNAITLKSKYRVPIIDELLDELAGACWFTKMDLKAGFHQIRLAPGEEYKTAFQTHHGHFEFLVVAMGLTGAPATFQGTINFDLSPLLRKCVLCFFDDILVFSKTFEEHLEHVAQVLTILKEKEWKVKMSKCAFAQQEIAYLGHVISAQGVSTDPAKITVVQQYPTPTNVKEVRGFLGLSGYYRKFIKHYGIIAKPLTELLKKGMPFVWTSVTEEAFVVLKQALTSAPVLDVPDFSKPFTVETDACEYGIGAVLMQQGHPLAFVSKALGPNNRGLSVYEKEYLAILLAIDQWRSYLQMQQFIIKTDHKSLAHLQDQRLHTPWQQKCLTKLLGLNYTI
nr:uncharacterized protein LOC109746825 [Aegilops tauschii subsp. strangulata]